MATRNGICLRSERLKTSLFFFRQLFSNRALIVQQNICAESRKVFSLFERASLSRRLEGNSLQG